MYLFDLYDYYFDRVIGNQYEEIPICDIKWCDMATTARATRDAYLSNLSQWYLASVTCLEDGDCKDAILAKWSVVQNDIILFNNALVAFWNMMCNDNNLEDCTGEYNPTLYQNYINAQDTLQCDIEELTYLIDDGVSGVNPTTTTTTTTSTTTTSTTTTTTIAPPGPIADCSTQTIVGSGLSGMYKIPMILPANVCDVMVTLDINTIPDSVAIMNSTETEYYVQSGFFGDNSSLPFEGYTTTYGPGQDLKIYKYDPTALNSFVEDPTASPQSITVIPQEYPITNTNVNQVPISCDPAHPDNGIRTITWHKGVTANDVSIMIRIVANPDYTNTSWDILGLTCLDCSTPCSCVGNEVTIGAQTWTCSNLNVSNYNNGDSIPQVTDPTEWRNLTSGAWCYYDNDPANGAIYGKLYNFYAVNDPRGLAPDGYHVASDAEWTTLTNYLGGETSCGGKLKEIGTTHWEYPNAGAINSSCFNGRPGGYREDGEYLFLQRYSEFWTSTVNPNFPTLDAYYRRLGYDQLIVFNASTGKSEGMYVRLVKD